MSADIADKLRALARDHLEGRSSLEAYRRLRAQLLDSLLAPAAGPAPEATQPRAASPPGAMTQPRPRAATREDVTQPREAIPPTNTRRAGAAPGSSGTTARVGRIAGYAGFGLLLACTAALLLWRHHSRTLASSSATTAGSAGMRSDRLTDPVRALLQPLLEHPDWSDARLVALNEALLEAGQPRIDAVRDTDWFDAFVQSVRSRLREQQALAGAPLTPDSSPLAALAVTLGIDLAIPAGTAHVPPGHAARDSREPGIAAPRVPGPGSSTREARESPKGAQQAAQGGKAAGKPVGKPRSSPARLEVAEPSSAAPVTASSHAAGVSPSVRSVSAASQATQPASAQGAPTSAKPRAASPPRKYPACSAALSQERLNYCQDFLASGEPGPLLAVIPRGSFMMGNSEVAEERPVHRVTLSYDFAMSVYEVSQSEFQLYCRKAGKVCPPQPWNRGDDPVVNVSWNSAQDYVRWLSRATHQKYRLPTEAEWEYAARAGQTGLYPSGHSLSPTDAYFSMGATLTAPAPRSMRFNANAWHLMHMVGNVREWVADAWSPTFSGAPVDGSARERGAPGIRVVRGGCYADPAIKLRLTTREPLPANTRDRCTGIRLVREIR